MLASAAALPVLEHALVGTLLPVERAALCYVPLFALTLLFTLEAARSCRRGRLAVVLLCAATALTLGCQFGRGFAARSSCAWWQDGHNPEVLALLDRDRRASAAARTVRLRASWVIEPSLNFYRLTRRYTWLLPVTREPITRSDADYIYGYEREVDTLLHGGDTRLVSYPDIGTVLVRVNRAGEAVR